MRPWALVLWLLAAPAGAAGLSAPADLIPLRTGPGAAYPSHHVLRAGEPLTVTGARGGWLRVRAPRGGEGWLPATALGTPPPRPWHLALGGGRLGPDPWVRLRLERLPRWWGLGLALAEGAGPYADHRLLDGHLALRLTWRRLSLGARAGIGGWWSRPRPELVAAAPRARATVHAGAAVAWRFGPLHLVAEGIAYSPTAGADTGAWTVGVEGRL